MTRDEAKAIARALREQRPMILNEQLTDLPQTSRIVYFAARDLYTNITNAMADEVYNATGGSFERDIFRNNARVMKLAPFTCTQCGQHITDGKPCGHGRRDELGIE